MNNFLFWNQFKFTKDLKFQLQEIICHLNKEIICLALELFDQIKNIHLNSYFQNLFQIKFSFNTFCLIILEPLFFTFEFQLKFWLFLSINIFFFGALIPGFINQKLAHSNLRSSCNESLGLLHWLSLTKMFTQVAKELKI
jgi:hypothetical protein